MQIILATWFHTGLQDRNESMWSFFYFQKSLMGWVDQRTRQTSSSLLTAPCTEPAVAFRLEHWTGGLWALVLKTPNSTQSKLFSSWLGGFVVIETSWVCLYRAACSRFVVEFLTLLCWLFADFTQIGTVFRNLVFCHWPMKVICLHKMWQPTSKTWGRQGWWPPSQSREGFYFPSVFM